MEADGRVLRDMRVEDLSAVLDVQQPAIAGLSEVFPRDGHIAGFAATKDAEIVHFGVALAGWGTGVAATSSRT